MKSTLADIKQLFNVKAIAYATTYDNLAEGQVGIYPDGSDTSVASGTTFAQLPAKFRIASKINGKLYFSLDYIEKAKIKNQVAKAYQSEQVNIWKGTIQGGCNCMNGVQLNLNIDEQSLIQRDGLTWTHRDFVYVVSPDELKCYCNCDGSKPVYENNILTNLLYQKVVASNSPFYTASIILNPASPPTTYATVTAMNAATGMQAGDFAITTSTSALYMYNGTAWVLVGSSNGTLSNADVIIQQYKTVNTDDDTTNDGPLLSLVIQGKPLSAGTYRDLEVNYVYPRGVKLAPAVVINGAINIPFTETQPLRYEIGAGMDLRAEEWENMNYYTDLNFYPRLSDGIANTHLVYQFENGKNYNTLTFEYGSKKTGLEDVFEGEYKQFGVLLGTDQGTVYTALQTMFIP